MPALAAMRRVEHSRLSLGHEIGRFAGPHHIGGRSVCLCDSPLRYGAPSKLAAMSLGRNEFSLTPQASNPSARRGLLPGARWTLAGHFFEMLQLTCRENSAIM